MPKILLDSWPKNKEGVKLIISKWWTLSACSCNCVLHDHSQCFLSFPSLSAFFYYSYIHLDVVLHVILSTIYCFRAQNVTIVLICFSQKFCYKKIFLEKLKIGWIEIDIICLQNRSSFLLSLYFHI